MSADGYLPDNVSEADFDRVFPPDCPDTCDSMIETYSECGGVGQCECPGGLNKDCDPVVGDCDCDERRADAKADRAEATADARADR